MTLSFRHILPLLLTFLSLSCFAVDKAPKINRVCLDLSDSTATIYWDPVSDGCGSFESYKIYGRPDKLSLYTQLATVNNINTNSATIKLPNKKKWQFYIVVNKTCNGVDSLFSDTVFVDIEEPTKWHLDSVSVDIATQKVIAGWSKHDTIDVEGYRIYHVTGVGASNILIGQETGYSFNGTKEDPTVETVTYLINAYDSCSNASPLSDSNTTIFLTKSIDTCTNTLFFNWSHYVGWPSIASYNLVVSTNGGPFTTVKTISGSSLSTTYKYTPGDSICALIRATHGTNSQITSSSNIRCQKTYALIKPTHLYIRKVTVENHNNLALYSIQDDINIDSLSLQKSNNLTSWTEITNLKPVTPNYYYQDLSLDVNNEVGYYRLIAYNKCGQAIDTSNISNNILLALNGSDLEWDEYSDFNGGVDIYNSISSTNSSTWNIEQTTTSNGPNSKYTNTISELLDIDGNAKCFCVYAIENGPNQHGFTDTSFSNQVCAVGELVIHIPNAFAPKGHNQIFKPYIQNADLNRYSLDIYNRWGEHVFSTNDINQGWNGTLNDQTCPMGAYTYTISIKGNDGASLNKSGIINLIR